LLKEASKDWAMSIILINHPIWAISLREEGMGRAGSNGIMEKSMMDNGKTGRRKEVEYGRVKEMSPTLVNGMQIQLKALAS
jgi:hypothetical protein